MTIEEASQLLSDWIHQQPADVAAQQAAMEHYGKLFRPENIANLTQDEFKGFLLLKNNKHGLDYNGSRTSTPIWIA